MQPDHRYAQTNVQLYSQLLECGRGAAELESVRSAYDLAAQLHAARFRPSGRTFLSHLVATASVLAALEAETDVVAAGLLHAAYEFGDFLSGTPGMTPRRRAILRREVGDEIEALVATYTALRWSPAAVGEVGARFDTLGARERKALLIRLANELEDHLDGGILYCAGAERRLAYIGECGAGMQALAHRLGYPLLAEELERAARACREGDVPTALRSRVDHPFDRVPHSLRQRWLASLARRHPRATWQLRRAARWLRRRLGRGD